LVQGDLGKKLDLISKITRAKRTGGMAQEEEYLPDSNPSTDKKKKPTENDTQ
jgi:hypothetical protein